MDAPRTPTPPPSAAPPAASRRTLLTVTAASAGALALTACGAESGGGGGETPDPGVATGEDLAALEDVPIGEPTFARTGGGGEAFLFRSDETTVTAFGTACTHQGCALQPAGVELRCPCHGSVFDAATGEVVTGPALEPLPTVRVKIEGDRIVAE
ncbi:Rieske (2Fe-2S) protein [Streptomyces avicenniae]|uniref:Rieske (2Fe-2S) protein n=1 Tax=Streptomyces avicenniae TaxID=500153 RepID=UPI00069AE902|nr:Rieske (2Fe-2S) protein [Streptomyces avicenniae]